MLNIGYGWPFLVFIRPVIGTQRNTQEQQQDRAKALIMLDRWLLVVVVCELCAFYFLFIDGPKNFFQQLRYSPMDWRWKTRR